MKRLALIVVVIPAFAAGVILNGVWQRLTTLPYCEIARNAERYHGETIRARATLIFGSDGMYVIEDCDPVSALASLVEFDGSNASRLRRNYVDEVLVPGHEARINKVDAIITGRFDAQFSPGCWVPAFRIVATEIQFRSRLTEYKPPGLDSSTRARHQFSPRPR